MTPAVEKMIGDLLVRVVEVALAAGLSPKDLETRLFDAIQADSFARLKAGLEAQKHEDR